MKIYKPLIFLLQLFLLLIFDACTISIEKESEIPLKPKTSQIVNNHQLLHGKWFAKQIKINGKEDPENYPVNNDEMIFNNDYTFISIDKTFDYEESGRWETIDQDKILLIKEEDESLFKINELTETRLVVTTVVDNNSILIVFSKIK